MGSFMATQAQLAAAQAQLAATQAQLAAFHAQYKAQLAAYERQAMETSLKNMKDVAERRAAALAYHEQQYRATHPNWENEAVTRRAEEDGEDEID
jgi:uncharacterized protein YbgA (DUF1722 family)